MQLVQKWPKHRTLGHTDLYPQNITDAYTQTYWSIFIQSGIKGSYIYIFFIYKFETQQFLNKHGGHHETPWASLRWPFPFYDLTISNLWSHRTFLATTINRFFKWFIFTWRFTMWLILITNREINTRGLEI